MVQDDKKSRDYFRVEYPPEVQPIIQLEDGSFPVINLCEGGVKFAFNTKDHDLKELEQRTFNATIVFHNHDRSQVIGTIIRADKGSVVLKLSQGVSFQKIMAEQRFLLNKYGTLRRPSDT
ncbi:MAG: hypothetical protein ACOH5I_08455 [Oligoflexus sp.]